MQSQIDQTKTKTEYRVGQLKCEIIEYKGMELSVFS